MNASTSPLQVWGSRGIFVGDQVKSYMENSEFSRRLRRHSGVWLLINNGRFLMTASLKAGHPSIGVCFIVNSFWTQLRKNEQDHRNAE
jgi:hypothetical protein